MPNSMGTYENPTEHKNNIITVEQKDLPDFEEGDWEEASLETVKSDLLRALRKLHRKQVEELLEKVAHIEEGCIKETRQALEKYMEIHLEKHFQKIAQSCQNNVSQMCAPLLKRAEEDVSRLNKEVNSTVALCQDIRQKYAFRWERPFLAFIAATSLTGAFVAFGILLMQSSSLSVFFMNEKSRKAYNIGLRSLESTERWKARQEEKKILEQEKKKKVISQKKL
jgi:hypothetical protein